MKACDTTESRGVVIAPTAKLNSTKPEPKYCVGSNPTSSFSEIGYGKNTWQWSQLSVSQPFPKNHSSSIYGEIYFPSFEPYLIYAL